MMVLHACFNNSAAQFEAYFGYDADDIAFGHGRIRSHDKIGAAEYVEMSGMVGNIEGAVEQFAQLFCGRGWVYMEERVQRFARCQMVCFRANTADPLCNLWHFLRRPALTELLESPQFRDLKIGIFHLPGVIEKDGDFTMSLQPGNWINGNFFHLSDALLTSESGRL